MHSSCWKDLLFPEVCCSLGSRLCTATFRWFKFTQEHVSSERILLQPPQGGKSKRDGSRHEGRNRAAKGDEEGADSQRDDKLWCGCSWTQTVSPDDTSVRLTHPDSVISPLEASEGQQATRRDYSVFQARFRPGSGFRTPTMTRFHPMLGSWLNFLSR